MVGEALQKCFARGKKREDVYILTKIYREELNDVEGAMRRSLKKLKLHYVDCYLIHFPFGYYAPIPVPMHKLWHDMETMVEMGLTKSIGVSNFNSQLLWDMMTYCKIKPAVNEIEVNPVCA